MMSAKFCAGAGIQITLIRFLNGGSLPVDRMTSVPLFRK